MTPHLKELEQSNLLCWLYFLILRKGGSSHHGRSVGGVNIGAVSGALHTRWAHAVSSTPAGQAPTFDEQYMTAQQWLLALLHAG